MMEISLIAVGLLGLGTVFAFRAAARAPRGYQDATGFHFGTPLFPSTGDTAYLPAAEAIFQSGRTHGPTPRPVVAVSAHHA